VTNLNLSWNDLDDTGAEYIADALRKNNTIYSLDLSSNQFTDEGMKTIAKSLIVNQSLHTLKVCLNEIRDFGVKGMADALRENIPLHTLDLSHNQISDLGMRMLELGLSSNRNLLYINLYGNPCEERSNKREIVRIVGENRKDKVLMSCKMNWIARVLVWGEGCRLPLEMIEHLLSFLSPSPILTLTQRRNVLAFACNGEGLGRDKKVFLYDVFGLEMRYILNW